MRFAYSYGSKMGVRPEREPPVQPLREDRLFLKYPEKPPLKPTPIMEGVDERGEPFSFRTIISVLRALGEIGRLQELILNFEESPEEIFLREQSSKPARKRASRER